MYLGRVYGECVITAPLALMVSGAFAVADSWTYIRIRCPIIQVPLPEVHNKTAKINGFTLQHPFLE